MPYLYHLVPPVMHGTTLLPRNMLSKLHPELSQQYARKYEGREYVKDYYIPPLDCRWGDVVFLSPVAPHTLLAACKRAGTVLYKYKFFEIDADKLDHTKMTIWTYLSSEKELSDFVPFTYENLTEFTQVPEKTIEYYKEQARRNEPKLLYAHIPHVLLKGSVDVSDAKIIQLR